MLDSVLKSHWAMIRVALRTLVTAAFLLSTFGGATPAVADPPPCPVDVLPSGALSMICVPPDGFWNGSLVVFAHGYVADGAGPTFANLALPDGTLLPVLVQSLGFAFATTTYRHNGLVILEGVDDVKELVAAFTKSHGRPLRTYVTGASEGGLVAALLAERAPQLFNGALSACAPIGSFQRQINYIGDFRVLFDYYFPGLLPGSAISIPQTLMDNWYAFYRPAVLAAIAGQPARTLELLRVALAPFDPAHPETAANTVVDLLWYSVFATNDATIRLGGNPFGNRTRWYFGSSNDFLLNFSVARFTESPVARAALLPYETTGDLEIPMVTVHTTADDVIPFAHELLYALKLAPPDWTNFTPLPIVRYGHCNFTGPEIGAAFLKMVGS
jgi:pimeloyl-ACP methyl ester carboxylesterase